MVSKEENPNLFTYVVDDIAIDLDSGREIDALCFCMDISSKAFDKVPHKGLQLKLSQYGIPKQLLDWIKDFLEGRTQSVVIGDYSRVLSGVPQGTVLALLLYMPLLLIQRSDYMLMI